MERRGSHRQQDHGHLNNTFDQLREAKARQERAEEKPMMQTRELLERLSGQPILQSVVLETLTEEQWQDYLDSIGVVTEEGIIGKQEDPQKQEDKN